MTTELKLRELQKTLGKFTLGPINLEIEQGLAPVGTEIYVFCRRSSFV